MRGDVVQPAQQFAPGKETKLKWHQTTEETLPKRQRAARGNQQAGEAEGTRQNVAVMVPVIDLSLPQGILDPNGRVSESRLSEYCIETLIQHLLC